MTYKIFDDMVMINDEKMTMRMIRFEVIRLGVIRQGVIRQGTHHCTAIHDPI